MKYSIGDKIRIVGNTEWYYVITDIQPGPDGDRYVYEGHNIDGSLNGGSGWFLAWGLDANPNFELVPGGGGSSGGEGGSVATSSMGLVGIALGLGAVLLLVKKAKKQR